MKPVLFSLSLAMASLCHAQDERAVNPTTARMALAVNRAMLLHENPTLPRKAGSMVLESRADDRAQAPWIRTLVQLVRHGQDGMFARELLVCRVALLATYSKVSITAEKSWAACIVVTR